MSTGMVRALETVYTPFAASVGLAPYLLHRHPDEGEIVREALGSHRARLLHELREARPSMVVTLGNAALRTLASVLGVPDGPRKLTAWDYGTPITVCADGWWDHWWNGHDYCDDVRARCGAYGGKIIKDERL
jgi:hypothetical protein